MQRKQEDENYSEQRDGGKWVGMRGVGMSWYARILMLVAFDLLMPSVRKKTWRQVDTSGRGSNDSGNDEDGR